MNVEETLRLKFTRKQQQAWDILKDETTIELLFGGGAGGGKSRLGCAWGIMLSLEYEGIRGFLARVELKLLKESTLLTFFDLCSELGLVEGEDYDYNETAGLITFLQTKSAIYLKELKWEPRDPNYDRLGSTEFTWGFIDEAQQIRQKAKNIMRSRIRYKLTENRRIAKMLETCNPSKSYLYTEFYKPNKEGTLPPDKKFLQALLKDNPFIEPSYLENLRGLDLETQERLIYGNWEYDDDPSALMPYIAITDIFSNVLPPLERDVEGKVKPTDKYIICDVARFGNDRTVISYWEGLSVKRLAVYTKLPTVPDPRMPDAPSVAGKLQEWRQFYTVPLSRVLVDEDGVGGGVVDYLHCKGFQGGRKPFPMPKDRTKPQNFQNLRAQCCYKLAEYVNARKMAVPIENPDLRDMLISELEQIKAKDHDEDLKLKIVGKDDIKEKIGRSPDLADNLMMRMWFEFAPVPAVYSVGGASAPAAPQKEGTRKLSSFERGE